MTEEHDARPTTTPAGGNGDSRPTPRELAAARRADAEPTLADANEDYRNIRAAKRLMKEWGVTTMDSAVAVAQARVRGASRRAGYDRQD
jgi:hypothetical protein